MQDISVNRAVALPLLLAVGTVALAISISLMTGVDGSQVFLPYLSTWAAVSLMAILCWVFIQVARLSRTLADRPLQTVMGQLADPCRLTIFPALIFPLFLAGYTWAKCSIPFAVGYSWEEYWANADHALFGQDAWRLAHSLMPAALGPAWTFFYSIIWGFALVFSGAFVATFASRRFTATFFTAMMLSWFVGGIVMAYAISAAGPVFAHLADPELAGRFLPLRRELVHILGEDDPVMLSQRYLAAGINVKFAAKGGGISAMPSMHIATATILVIASLRTRWLPLAGLFWVMTFFGSIYLGFHYAVDAPIAAVIAVSCWAIARRIYGSMASAKQPKRCQHWRIACD